MNLADDHSGDPQPWPDGLGFVFVVTYGRSGSTLIQSLLNALPGYCIRGENQDLLAPMADAWQRACSSPNLRAMRLARVRSEPDNPWFGGENLDPDRLGLGLARLFVQLALRPPPGTRVTGCKEIRWGGSPAAMQEILRFAMAVFPGVRFVFNTRDHEQVLRSAWWASQPPEQVRQRLAKWDAAYDAFLRAHPDRGVRVHYNDYVRDPEALRPVFDLLGEPWDRDMVARILARPLNHGKAG